MSDEATCTTWSLHSLPSIEVHSVSAPHRFCSPLIHELHQPMNVREGP